MGCMEKDFRMAELTDKEVQLLRQTEKKMADECGRELVLIAWGASQPQMGAGNDSGSKAR